MAQKQVVIWLSAILFAAACPDINLYHDGYIDQKWSMTVIVILALMTYVLLFRKKAIVNEHAIASASCVLTIYLFSYTYLSYFLKSPVLTGPFENPNVLSIHLCLLLPFVHNGQQRAVGARKKIIIILEIISILTIILTECRTGWICLAFGAMTIILKGRWKCLILPLIISFGVFLALSVKQPSSLGRSFILNNTLELISQAPLLGHGLNGFDRLYMPHQAEYFRTHNDKDLEMLADDIRHPLNEFLLVTVNHGILGSTILAILILIPLIWRRKLYMCCRPLWQSMLMLFIYCLFSYPLLYPMSWLVFFGSWLVLLHEKITAFVISSRLFLLPVLGVLLIITFGYTLLLLGWGYASRQAKLGHSAEMMDTYARLYPYLSWRGIFLYDYAIESLYADQNEQAYKLAEECRVQHVSYDLALLEGDICRYLKCYNRALECFDEASLMCPVRFAPPYGKWHVYKETGDTVRKDSMKQVIRHKEIKVYSRELIKIYEDINN